MKKLLLILGLLTSSIALAGVPKGSIEYNFTASIFVEPLQNSVANETSGLALLYEAPEDSGTGLIIVNDDYNVDLIRANCRTVGAYCNVVLDVYWLNNPSTIKTKKHYAMVGFLKNISAAKE